jgi:ribonucleoside-diphosphate reductase alpha chain
VKKDEMTLSLNAEEILKRRYLLKDERGEVIETPPQMFARVAKAVASAEQKYGKSKEDVRELERRFYQLTSDLEFLPNSPTLMNAGTELGQLAACFVLPVEDSMEGIFGAVKNMAVIHQSGGGTGFSFSRLRPKGDVVKSTGGIASGPVSFMRVFDVATGVIKQGGKRRGANMGILNVDHPDIMEFIRAKGEGEFANFNTSIAVTDEFMRLLERNGAYDLINPRTHEVVSSVNAREVFDEIVTYAWKVGDPGLIFIDEINRHNPLPALGAIEATNPCSEQPLLPSESCTLGSVNVSRFVTAVGGEVDWERLKAAIWLGVRFLDDVIDVNRYPLPEIEEMSRANRKIGLGVMGFAELLIKLGIPYDSTDALSVAERLMRFVTEEARQCSQALGLERGSFPNFELSSWRIYKAMRNATVTTIAPTGTISIIAGCSSGIEPLFAVAFVRNVMGGMLEINGLFNAIAKERGFYSKELIAEIAKRGSITDIDGIPADIKRLFVTALDISPEWHVRMQAAFQKYTDNAVSKCISGDTLIMTNKGLLKIKDCGEAEGEDNFGNPLANLHVLDSESKKRKVLSHYSSGYLKATKIKLSDGSFLVGATNSHRVKTTDGWKILGEVKRGDLVVVKRYFKPQHTAGGRTIDFDFKFRTNANRVNIPERMNPELAEWLGMMAADGNITLRSGFVGIHEKNREVGIVLDKLTRSIFCISPKVSVVDKRKGVVAHYLTSRPLARWVENQIGKGAYEKHVPKQILEGSGEEKMAFVNGVTLDGYLREGRGLVVYEGMSKRLAYEIAEMLRSFGLPHVYQGGKEARESGKRSYYVEVSNELQEMVTPVEHHKRREKGKNMFKKQLILIDPKEVEKMSLPTSHPEYTNLRWLKQSRRNYCWDTVAKKLGLSILGEVEKVVSAEDAGYMKMYDIEVDGSHDYLVNGIVSHNTVNLPSNATREDVKNVFLLAYELKCKGITVYRYGSKEQVLSLNIPKLMLDEYVSVDSEYTGECRICSV